MRLSISVYNNCGPEAGHRIRSTSTTRLLLDIYYVRRIQRRSSGVLHYFPSNLCARLEDGSSPGHRLN